MRNYVESTGKTEEAAVNAVLDKLGLDRSEVGVEVLERARSGFLGIGASPARVRVSYEVPDELPFGETPEDESNAHTEKKADADTPEASSPNRESAPVDNGETAGTQADPGADDPTSIRIAEFLDGLLARMEVHAQPKISVDTEGNYLVDLVGDGLGAVIGHRGETLDVIQQLTSYVVSRKEGKRVRVRIDAEGYRLKREESLRRMARRTAEKVIRLRRNMTLEPMNAYERHVIHTALQDYPDVSTHSVGSEPNRRTVIAYTPGENR